MNSLHTDQGLLQKASRGGERSLNVVACGERATMAFLYSETRGRTIHGKAEREKRKREATSRNLPSFLRKEVVEEKTL